MDDGQWIVTKEKYYLYQRKCFLQRMRENGSYISDVNIDNLDILECQNEIQKYFDKNKIWNQKLIFKFFIGLILFIFIVFFIINYMLKVLL